MNPRLIQNLIGINIANAILLSGEKGGGCVVFNGTAGADAELRLFRRRFFLWNQTNQIALVWCVDYMRLFRIDAGLAADHAGTVQICPMRLLQNLYDNT